MNKTVVIASLVITLLLGGFLGYYFTNSHYISEEAKQNLSDERIICSLELREGNIGEVKSKYMAIMGGKDKSLCNKYMPIDSLPDDTEVFSIF